MSFAMYDDLGHGITRIDSGMIRHELAACYLLQSGDDVALLETGTHNTIPFIRTLMQERNIAPEQVRYVIPTHVHLDHAGGVGGLMQMLPKATLLVHPLGARHMIDPAKLKAGAIAVYGESEFARIYGDVIPVAENRVRSMQDGESVQLGSRELVFYDTPGHARHHFCIHDPQSAGIFTGDTFGLAYPSLHTANGPFLFPTTTPVQFDPAALQQSIRKLAALQAKRIYLTHYGMIEAQPALVDSLIEQIDAYVAIADDVAAHYNPGEWEAAVCGKLTAYTFARARAHGCTQSDDLLQKMLGMDMRLNSQGIAVWMASRKH